MQQSFPVFALVVELTPHTTVLLTPQSLGLWFWKHEGPHLSTEGPRALLRGDSAGLLEMPLSC